MNAFNHAIVTFLFNLLSRIVLAGLGHKPALVCERGLCNQLCEIHIYTHSNTLLMEDKKSMIGSLRQKAKLLRYSRVGSDKNPNKPEVREERLLDQRMNTSMLDVLQRSQTSSLKRPAHQQPADLRTSSACNSSPTTPLSVTLRKKGGGTGLADSLDSTDWPSQESVTDAPCEEHNISKSTDEMDQVLRLRDTPLPSSESLAEVKRASDLDLSVGLIIKGGRKFSVPLLCMGNI